MSAKLAHAMATSRVAVGRSDLDEPFPFLQGYTPSGTYRGSIDISTPAPYPYKTTPEHRKAYDNLTFTGVRFTCSVCHAARWCMCSDWALRSSML